MRRVIGVVTVFCLICFAWIFFRAESLGDAWYVVTHLFSGWGAGLRSYVRPCEAVSLGMRWCCWPSCWRSGFMEFVHWWQRKGDVRHLFAGAPLPVRWLVWYGLIFGILDGGRVRQRPVHLLPVLGADRSLRRFLHLRRGLPGGPRGAAVTWLDAVVTAGLRKADLPDVPELAQWNDIVSGEAGSDLLIQGSSRPWVGVSPAILSDRLGLTCYNLGVNGYPLQMQLARYKLYRRYNAKPRVIVQAVDTHTFTRGDDLFANNQFLPYLDQRSVKEAVGPYEFFRWYDYYLPLVRYRGKVQMIERGMAEALGIRQLHRLRRIAGYRPNDWSWSDDFAKYVAAASERGGSALGAGAGWSSSTRLWPSVRART